MLKALFHHYSLFRIVGTATEVDAFTQQPLEKVESSEL